MIGPDLPPGLEIPKPAIIRPAEHSLLRPGAFHPCDRAERRAIMADLVRTRRLTPDEARRALLFVPVVGWATSLDPFNLAYVGTSEDATVGLTTYSFSGVSIGEDVSAGLNTRITVLAVMLFDNSGQSTTISSGNVGSANLGSAFGWIAKNEAYCFFTAADTTGEGASANVSITLSNAGIGIRVGVYRVINPSGGTTPYATATDSTPSSGVCDVSLSVPTDGKAIGIVGTNNAGAFTWSGLNEDYEDDMLTNEWYGCASGGAAGAPHSVTVTSSDSTPGAMCACTSSWGPP